MFSISPSYKFMLPVCFCVCALLFLVRAFRQCQVHLCKWHLAVLSAWLYHPSVMGFEIMIGGMCAISHLAFLSFMYAILIIYPSPVSRFTPSPPLHLPHSLYISPPSICLTLSPFQTDLKQTQRELQAKEDSIEELRLELKMANSVVSPLGWRCSLIASLPGTFFSLFYKM